MLKTLLILMYLMRNQHWCALHKTNSLTSSVNVENDRHSLNSIHMLQMFRITKKGFHVLHINIHYLYPKLDENQADIIQ